MHEDSLFDETPLDSDESAELSSDDDGLTITEQVRASRDRDDSYREFCGQQGKGGDAAAAVPFTVQQVERALKRAPGNLTPQSWRAILRAHGCKCVYCGIQDYRLTLDHLKPVVLGGRTDDDNVVPACGGCNSRKHGRADFGWLGPRREAAFKVRLAKARQASGANGQDLFGGNHV